VVVEEGAHLVQEVRQIQEAPEKGKM